MDNEIEALYALLGLKLDEPGVSKAVNEMIKKLQSKLNSSIYGGKDGVITLPATIEGKFKNGRELSQNIKDAYVAIYNKAKEMADESVSLTLKDINDFKKSIDQFSNMTSKYKSTDIISNANNNLRQTLSDYQDFVNGLRIKVDKAKKVKIKQTQKANAQRKAETKETTYGISEEEINNAIEKEKKRQMKGLYEITNQMGYKHDTGIDLGKTNSHEANASKFSAYASNWARDLAKTLKKEMEKSSKEIYTYINKNIKEGPKGSNSRATTDEEFMKDIRTQAKNELEKLLTQIKEGVKDISFEDLIDQIGVLRTVYAKSGKSLEETFNDIGKAFNNVMNHNEDDSKKGKNYKGAAAMVSEAYKIMGTLWGSLTKADDSVKVFAKELEKTTQTIKKRGRPKKDSTANNSIAAKELERAKGSTETQELKNLAKTAKETVNAISETAAETKNVGNAITDNTRVTQIGTTDNVIEAAKTEKTTKKSIDTAIENKDINKKNIETGLNTDDKTQAVIDILQDILTTVTEILTNVVPKGGTNLLSLPEGSSTPEEKKSWGEIITELKAAGKTDEEIHQILADISNEHKGKSITSDTAVVPPVKPPKMLSGESENKPIKSFDFKRSEISTSVKDASKWFVRLKDNLAGLLGVTANYKKVMQATSDEQDKMAADRINKYGFSRGNNITGDKIQTARSMSMWRGTDAFEKVLKNLKITEPVKIDTTEFSDKLNKVLTGKQMRNAQMGGSPLRQVGGAFSAFIGMPSLEKSRAAADALNDINAKIREAMNDTVNTIMEKEQAVQGMLDSGALKVDSEGNVLENSTPEAKTLVAELENAKVVLASILADNEQVNKVVKDTHGNIGKIMQQLSFTSPALRECNSIVNNINAGYNKSGKALKFQTRTAELLNYTFQLISRSIGQSLKKIIMMINPFNLIKGAVNGIKRSFSDFMSYDTKWKRTMNVIKYNLRSIIRPFMEWIAQKLVNILGIIDIIQQKVQKAFGLKGTSLFDQSAANAEKMREELEQAANVTAGFDELHDIGSDNSAENDLMGDIYMPQLSDKEIEWANKLGDALVGVIDIFKKIKDALAWCIEHWKIFAGLLAAFAIGKALWDLLKWAGDLKSLLGGLNLLKFGNLLLNLTEIAGWFLIILSYIRLIKDSVIDWGKYTPKELKEKNDKSSNISMAGGGLVGLAKGIKSALSGDFLGIKGLEGISGGIASGIVGAIKGAGIAEAVFNTVRAGIAMFRGDTAEVKNAGVKIGEGLGIWAGASAGAKVGAAISGWTMNPVIIAAATTIGAVIGGILGSKAGQKAGEVIGDALNGILDITRGKGDFQKLKVSAKDVEKAYEGLKEKTDAYNKSLSELQELEEQEGITGKELYETVENGTKSYYGLTDSQKALYDKYKETMELEQAVNDQKLKTLEVAAKYEEQQAKESGNFKNYIATLKDGVEEGVISHEDMLDHFAQTYGSLDAEAKKAFVDQLPAYYRDFVKDQGAEYETFGNKTATFFKDWGKRIVDNNKSAWISIKDGWKESGIKGAIEGAFEGVDTWFANSANSLKILGATEDDVAESSANLAEAQENQTRLQAEVDRLQRLTNTSAEELWNQLGNGEIAYEDLTSDQQLLVNKYGDLRDAMAKTDECAKINAQNIASVDLQAAKTSGNYDTFIQNLMDANARGEISTEEMNDLFAQAYADMDRKGRESFESQAKEHGLMVNTIRTNSNEYLGILGILKKNAGNIWTDLKDHVSTKAKEMWENTTTKFGEIRDKAGEIWENIKTSAGITWGDIKDSAIGQKVQEIWKNTTDKFKDIKDEAGRRWDEIKTAAGQKWDDIKNSAVGQKVQDMWNNVTTKVEDMKNKVRDKFNSLKDTASGIWDNIKTTANQKWQGIKDTIKGWVDSLWNAITGVFNNIKTSAEETWQRVCNFFSGKGFRTNEQVDSKGGRNVSIAAYAVGTNYVPSDGLAYLHQGEAVIPAKYNKPYSNSSDGQMVTVLAQMTSEIDQLRNLINQGISVTGEFRQKGGDLYAVVEKQKSRNGLSPISNGAYAR